MNVPPPMPDARGATEYSGEIHGGDGCRHAAW
jgi:hypothetical protein